LLTYFVHFNPKASEMCLSAVNQVLINDMTLDSNQTKVYQHLKLALGIISKDFVSKSNKVYFDTLMGPF